MTNPDPGPPPAIDTSRPHPARVYDYFLDGKDHFPADRKAGEQVLEAVLLVAILHFLTDQDRPERVVGRFVDAMAPGSCLVISHATADFNPAAATQAARAYEHATAPIVLRSHAEVARLFCGLPMVPPGLVQLPDWRPDPSAKERLEVWAYGGVGQRP